jgi:hypothetical protein
MKRTLSKRLVSLVLAFVAPTLWADANPPVSIVITYKALPGQRIAFRDWVETEGAARFARWKADGVFSECLLLFGTFQTANPDLVVVLDFENFTDSARWREIARGAPGGLDAAAQKLAMVVSTDYSELIARGAAERRDPARGTWLIITYAYTTGAAYRDYVANYTVPQMKEWMSSGALASYTMHLSATPFNVPWESMLLLEYDGIEGLARRDEVKAAARVRLNASDPVFKSYSESKAEIRRDLAIYHADPIALPE